MEESERRETLENAMNWFYDEGRDRGSQEIQVILEAEKAPEMNSPLSFQKEGWLIPWFYLQDPFQTSDFQNCKVIHL